MNDKDGDLLEPRDVPDEKVQEILRELEASAEGEVKEVQNGTQQEFRRAVHYSTEILHGAEHASRLSERHNSLCRGQAMILAMELRAGEAPVLQLLRDANPGLWEEMDAGSVRPGHSTAIQRMREVAKRRGFFLMPYSEERMKRILTDSRYLVTEASGAHPAHPEDIAPLADCQCRLPVAGMHAMLEDVIDVPVVEKGDEVLDPMWDAMEAQPWSVALVEDIACADTHPIHGLDVGDLGLAGMARRRAFHHIETVVNAERKKFPIRYIGANIACVKGFIRPDGTIVLLHEQLDDPASIKNDRSVLIHTEGRNPATLVYKLDNRTVPVRFGEGGGSLNYKLITSWLGYVHDLSHFNPEARAARAERLGAAGSVERKPQ